ncbi:hypothetical protein Y1Q_0022220 [Alligator mississippiensis]|uniref:Uncharacterized protein n=1 Tax=Alligator mississippiensis TaxID=8496 RepID=A0A151NZQ5_ALLMI|nr:hypothetical protein Y1Q_0022220 [Alligator mississippiensis]
MSLSNNFAEIYQGKKIDIATNPILINDSETCALWKPGQLLSHVLLGLILMKLTPANLTSHGRERIKVKGMDHCKQIYQLPS